MDAPVTSEADIQLQGSDTDVAGQADEQSDSFDEGESAVDIPSEGIRLDKNDRSLSEFFRWYQAGRLVVDPEWQRSYIWDKRRASRLIESFLVDIPVPVIYLAKNEAGKYDVIDGVQRLTSIFHYFSNEFALDGLEFLDELSKKKFAELSPAIQSKLQDATLRTFELSPQTSKKLLFNIFQRLNSGGVALNEMEIRNCIYAGKLINLVKRLATLEEFVNSIHQRDLGKRMLDRALVLRFLAFYEKGYLKAQGGLKAFLNDFCGVYRDAPTEKIADFEKQFKKSMRAARTIFGDNAFRLRRQDEKGGGEWGSQINAAVFQVISTSFTNYDLAQLTQRADAVFEEYLDMITSDRSWVDSVTRSTGDTNKIRYSFETWKDRLAAVLSNTSAVDTQRAFSQALKRELYSQNPECAICGQTIRLINDAALDHEQHYWRAGKTIPSNARLVHRLCNLQRGGR